MRDAEADGTARLLEEQEILRSELSTILATECVDAANRTEQFATEQAETARNCRETMLLPHFEQLRDHQAKAVTNLENLQSHLHTQVNAEEVVCLYACMYVHIYPCNTIGLKDYERCYIHVYMYAVICALWTNRLCGYYNVWRF